MQLTDILNQLGAARLQTGRDGEHWPQGPIVVRSGTGGSLGDLHSLVKDLTTTEDDLAIIYRRLRRTHYSNYVRWTLGKRRGARLDALLAGGDDLPITWSVSPPGPSPLTVDGLAALGLLVMQANGSATDKIDVGALFTALEATFYGGSALGTAASIVTGLPFDGIATWVGDLAAWFLRWNESRIAAESGGVEWTPEHSAAQLNRTQASEAPIEVMLGSIDGTNLSTYLMSTVPTSALDVPAPQDLLEQYYDPSLSGSLPADFPTASDRWRHFVQNAIPAIPFLATANSVEVAPNAATIIAGYVSSVSAFFLHHASRDKAFRAAISAPIWRPGSLSDARAAIAADEPTIRSIAERFIELIGTGVTSGTTLASWPRMA